MEAVFLKLVNMSITASWLVLAIIAVRFIFKKTPKWIHCLLWGLVAFRLICPISFESSMSLIPNAEPISHEAKYIDVTMHPARGEILDSEGNVIAERDLPAASGEILDLDGNIILENKDGVTSYREKTQTQIWMPYLSIIWIVGLCGMLIYTIVSYYLLKRKVATSIPVKKGIKQSEFVDSPFVLGIVRPVIYLPFDMEEGDLAHVIAHEKAHIRRKDHWWKPLGFLLLSIYWFNPLLWVAYILLCRDIETACDEKVIQDMDRDDRRSYSTALLNCSVHRRRIAACPLAFGETGVKSRIKSIMDYRKPAFWVVWTSVLLGIVIAVCFLTNPKNNEESLGMHVQDITPEGLTVVYDSDHILQEEQSDLNYWLERYDEQSGSWDTVKKIGIFLVVEPENYDRTIEVTEGENPNSHILDWRVNYGYLTDGRYRVGIHFPKPDSEEVETLYAEFKLEGVTSVYTWKNLYSDSDVYTHRENNYLTLPGTKDVKIQFDAQNSNDIIVKKGDYGSEEVLISGGTIWNAFLTDISGDGVAEICATLSTNGEYEIQVYDYISKQRYTLNGGETHQYRLVERQDRLFLLKTDFLTTQCAQPVILDNRLELAEIEKAYLPLTETIVCVDITMNLKQVCLSSPEEIDTILTLLDNARSQLQSAPETVLQAAQEDEFHINTITFNYSLGKSSIQFSEDFSLMWEVGKEEGYVIANPEPLHAYVEAVTNGVKNRETSGESFATVDTPWVWCNGINLNTIEFAQAHIYTSVGPRSASASMGAITERSLQELCAILNQLPEAAFQQGPTLEQKTYHDIFPGLQALGSTVEITDPVNGLIGVIRYRGKDVLLVLSDELDKMTRDSGAKLNPTKSWRIEDANLMEYMKDMYENPQVITYFVGAEYSWQDPVVCSNEAMTMELRLIEGWEYEMVSGDTHSGIRFRPAEVTEGWLYFSFWPEGYHPQEENRYYTDGVWFGYPVEYSYPAHIGNGVNFDTRNQIWSYKRAETGKGDCAFINEGADDWFLTYYDEIQDTLTLCNFSIAE